MLCCPDCGRAGGFFDCFFFSWIKNKAIIEILPPINYKIANKIPLLTFF